MATKIELSPQEQINQCLRNKNNFLLSGGAGSGKTYTLVEIFNNKPNSRVACITYTNVATNEIKERIPYANLWVSTIHEFLWKEIQPYQKNLKNVFDKYLNTDRVIDVDKITSISYKNYRDLENGIVSHNDIIELSNRMFQEYPTLARILCSQYDYILIDEYQDTDFRVIEIFLSLIEEAARGKLCIGMFGDKMQSIYDSGIESKNKMEQFSSKYKTIEKKDNYRCSQTVIELLNKLRNDGIQQVPSNRDANDKILNKEGSIKFTYSDKQFSTEMLSSHKMIDIDDVKILMLTHNLIAKHNNFSDIISAYKDANLQNDQLLGKEPDNLARLLLKVGDCIEFFENKSYRSLTNRIDRVIESNNDKKLIADTFRNINNTTIGEALRALDAAGIIKSQSTTDKYLNDDKLRVLFSRIALLSLQALKSYHSYYNNHLPFSTQHSVKGTEYDNVVVVLDNGRWSKYDFVGLFSNPSADNTTKNLFYVCCSRAKDNLVVFMQSPNDTVVEQAKVWFGEDNCINMDS